MNTLSYKTESVNKKNADKKWFLVDANGQNVGRLASQVAKIIRGKHKTAYTPHADCGDNVVVINAKGIRLTGSKEKKKTYFKHTGYPGGIKETKFLDIISGKTPELVLTKAVQRMMNSNALSKKQLSNLKIFSGNEHNLEAQKPEVLDFASLNRKNKYS